MKIDDFIATLAVKDTGCRATTHPLLKAQLHPAAARELLGKSRADLYPKWLRGTEAESLFAVVSRVPARTPLGRKCNAPLSSDECRQDLNAISLFLCSECQLAVILLAFQ